MDDTTVDLARQRLSFQQAASSPCEGCLAPCCTVLPLHDFQITRYSELDYALYLLNFDRIELNWLDNGSWRAHYRMPCHRIDPQTYRCTVHGTSDQPHICKRYSPYNCSYKPVFMGTQSAHVRIDRGRMEALAAMLVFDGERNIVGWPDRQAAVAYLPPLAPVDDPPAPPAPLLDQWEAAARHQRPLSGMQARRYADFHRPCEDCAAYCCTHLVFPHAPPQSVANLDHLRFCMGFPGVEIGLSPAGEWVVIVRTTCRNLTHDEHGAGRCGLYGAPGRPQICIDYDGAMCGYKMQFGRPRPERYLRMRFPQFDRLVELFHFDEDGYVIAAPDFNQIRQHIEQRWVSEGPLTPGP